MRCRSPQLPNFDYTSLLIVGCIQSAIGRSRLSFLNAECCALSNPSPPRPNTSSGRLAAIDRPGLCHIPRLQPFSARLSMDDGNADPSQKYRLQHITSNNLNPKGKP